MPISWQATVRPALAAAILALLGSAAGAETIALRGGDNLAEAVRRAADGDVIRLEPDAIPDLSLLKASASSPKALPADRL